MTSIPQILAITEFQNGCININKRVKSHLNLDTDDGLFLDLGREISFSRNQTRTKLVLEKSRRAKIPQEVQRKLQLSHGDQVALIQRDRAVAVKKLLLESVDSVNTKIVDIETPTLVQRIMKGRLNPQDELARLRHQNKGFKLKHELTEFLQNRQTLEAWKARQFLGMHGETDNELKEKWIHERIASQLSNGSWENNGMVTARVLRELASLGLPKESPTTSNGVKWLLDKPESPHNPGMFFLNEKLVQEQVKLVEERKRVTTGSRPRFRKLLASENSELILGDNMVKLACGPRIMWPNAFVLETLLMLGYENHERVQRLLGFLKHGYWCECGYQHGNSDLRGLLKPLDEEEIGKLEQEFLNQYRYLGLSEFEELAKLDLSRKVGLKLPRASETQKNDEIIYELSRFDHVQGCEVMTVRALCLVDDPVLRRLVDAYLWRIAAVQKDSGMFSFETRSGRYPKNMFFDNQYGFLEFFARFDHTASHIVINRALPWIIANQNSDGSWGTEKPDIATYSVIKALYLVSFEFA